MKDANYKRILQYTTDYNCWDEFKFTKKQYELIDNLLPKVEYKDKTLDNLRNFIIECIKRELWIYNNYDEAKFLNQETLGEDYIFELIIQYTLCSVDIMTTYKKLKLLELHRNGYKYIRRLKSQLYGIDTLDKKFIKNLYNIIDDLKLDKFFNLMFPDKINEIKKINKE